MKKTKSKRTAASQIKMALDKLTTELEKGTSEQFKACLAAMAKFHRYSWSNVLLIMSQRNDARHVAGYRTWQKLGRQVKQGEKGIQILAPIVYRRSRADNGKAEETHEQAVAFKAAHVFDVSQTDGNELPEPVKVVGDPSLYLGRLRQFVQSQGIKLEYADLHQVEGFAETGRIVLRQGLEPAEEFSTMVHELSHSLLHQRDREKQPTRMVRETEAEATAYIVCEAIGLETRTASSDYIAAYKGQKDTLAKSLQRIQQTASEIIEGITAKDEECLPFVEAGQARAAA